MCAPTFMPKCKRLCVNIRHEGLAEKSLCLNTISLSKYPLHFSPSSNPRSHSAAANSGCTGEDSLNHHFHHFHSAIVPLLAIFYNSMLISARRRAIADRNSLNFPTNDLTLNQKTFKFICQFQILAAHAISTHPSSHFPSLYLALSAFLAACFPHDQPGSWLMPCSLSHPSVSIH